MNLAAAGLLAFSAATAGESLHYRAEWRRLHAGYVHLDLEPASAHLKLETAGLAAKLYPLKDDYSVRFRGEACTDSILFRMQEGRKHREAKAAFPPSPGKSDYKEVDLVKNTVERETQLDVPGCVHDVIAGLVKLRGDFPSPGTRLSLPMSDGRKFASVEVRALQREKVNTPAGEYAAVRYEAGLFNGVIYRRKARMYVWLSDDHRRIPVQVRVQMPFYLGTVTIQLEKEDKP
jgi:hypothetical protein